MTPAKKTDSVCEGRPMWAEVSLGALTNNFRAIRALVNPVAEKRKIARKVLCIVKGNGYGHGGPQVAKALEKAGTDWFGVTSAQEGVALRKAKVRKPILVLTSFWPGEETNLLKNDLTPVVHRCEQLEALERAAKRQGQKRLRFHLKIDTGMNRIGILPENVECFAQQLAKCKHLELGGVMTHFASSEAFTQSLAGEQTRQQEKTFYAALQKLRKLGVDTGIVHLANSGAIVARPETWADMVRPGVILYGYHPGYEPEERRAEYESRLALQPVMSLRSRIITMKNVRAGEGVGYGATWVAKRATRVGIIAAGYGDGLHRSLGNRGSVLVRDQFAPLVGIVSMDVSMVDLTDVQDAQWGDVVTIYGKDREQVNAANRVARSIGTVTSDLLCAVSHRVPRIYVA
jgi:alanine racemase